MLTDDSMMITRVDIIALKIFAKIWAQTRNKMNYITVSFKNSKINEH